LFRSGVAAALLADEAGGDGDRGERDEGCHECVRVARVPVGLKRSETLALSIKFPLECRFCLDTDEGAELSIAASPRGAPKILERKLEPFSEGVGDGESVGVEGP